MKLFVSRPGRWIALSLFAVGLVSGHALPARASQAAAAAPVPAGAVCRQEPATGPESPFIISCEAALAACMNGGGDSDTCWNAYWRCISQ
jgi:hypothetical protein